MEIELPDGTILDAPDDADPSAVAKAYLFRQSIPKQSAPARPYDPFNDAPRLPGETGYEESSPKRSALSDARKYFEGLNQAFGGVNRAKGSGLVGGLETAGTLFTGAISPVTALLKHIGTGEMPTPETMDQYSRDLTYSPRTEQGKAQLNLIGAATAPLTESGADVALLPLVGAQMPKARPSVPSFKPTPVPSTQQLATAAKDAYAVAKDAGVVIKPESFSSAVSGVRKTVTGEGYHPRLHPKASVALDELDVAASKGEPVTLEQVEQLRRIAKSAEKSIEPDERRIASEIVDGLDEYIDNISEADTTAGNGPAASAALKDARGYYTRNRKSAEIEGLIERARERSSQFSGSGLENALRTEFRQLAMNDKRMRRFSKEEQAAIRQVSRGGNMENALRFMGKFAPTGVVSAVLSGGAGAMLGGPFGAALPLTGLASRAVATKMTLNNANRAAELMRRGPAITDRPTHGLLGTAQSAADIQGELQRLDATASVLAPSDPRQQILAAEAARLRSELEGSGSRASGP